MELNIFDLVPILSDISTCINFLRGRNLLVQDYFCCNQTCSKVRDPKTSDNEVFQCKLCRRRYSIRSGSFWAKSKLSLLVLVSVLYFFCKGCSVSETVNMLSGKITKMSVIQWFNYFRDVMMTYYERNEIIFQNCVVHIDETFIGGKQKYNRGRVPAVQTRFLLGIIDIVSKKAFVQFVPKRDFINIIPTITRHVRPGCTINTNGARVYNALNNMNYIHNVVIHKENFIDPTTGHHSNWIEGF